MSADTAVAAPAAGSDARLRSALAVLLVVWGIGMSALKVSTGNFPTDFHVAIIVFGIAIWFGRGIRFARDWLPVMAVSGAYAFSGRLTEIGSFPLHQLPQIDIDRVIGFGRLPTVWLQQHLYSGTTGVLEVAVTLVYCSHYLVPPLVAFYIWLRRREGFSTYLWGLLVVSILGDITFVLAPTAPPWLAADHGLIPPVHHVIKDTLYSMHMTAAASLKDTGSAYNITAAVPSLHAAWPVVGILVARRLRLPRWVRLGLVAQFVAVVFSIVYAGEHYVTDALAGALYAYVAYRLVVRVLGRRAEDREPGPAAPAPARA